MENTWKASELVVALQKAIEEHGDLPIKTEGCDCWGDAQGVHLTSVKYPEVIPVLLLSRRVELDDCL